MEDLKEYIEKEIKKLDTGIVVTPENREALDSQAGSKNFLIVQIAVQFGYKIALQNIENQIS